MSNGRTQLSTFARRALLSTVYEYFLVTLPVAIFVTLEALHKEDRSFCWSSPEWAIATIFLLFQGLSLYIRELTRTGRKISEGYIGILGLVVLVGAVITSINAYQSLHENTNWGVSFRLAFFGLASIAFILMVGGAKLAYLNTEQRAHG